MKKVIFLTFVLFLFCINAKPQEVKSNRQAISERAVPKIVAESFYEQYPEVIMVNWFVTHITYWFSDYSSSWYYDWYGPRTVVLYTFEKDNYYEVEFMVHPGETSRAIYNKYGYWYETRTIIKGFPKEIIDALYSSKYKDWKIAKLKEKIETPAWPEPIYRFKVSKGLKNEILRMDEFGNLVQSKQLSE